MQASAWIVDAVGGAVVGHHPLDLDAVAAKWATARRRKPIAVVGFLVGEDLDVGEPGRVVDADVDVLPADPARPPVGALPVRRCP